MSNRSARGLLIRVNLGLLTCGLALAQPGIVTFDAPGAGTGFRQGTTATGINAAGVIAGYYVDANNLYHGFVRATNGVITEFDAAVGGAGTLAYGINDADAVTGYYLDTQFVAHGFVRSASGVITTFDVPAYEGSGTYAFSINDAGVVAGFFFQAGESFSFIRGPSGVFDTFAAGPGNPGLNGTRACSINNAYAVTGFYSTGTTPQRGFIRDPNGNTATFRAPNAGLSDFQGTNAVSINNVGAITGDYIDARGQTHGFVRSPGGEFVEFGAPGQPGATTLPASINDSGAVAGSYTATPAGLSHGFARSAAGVFTSFDVRGAGGASYSGTYASGVNDAGTIAGYFIDARSASHGFVRTPVAP